MGDLLFLKWPLFCRPCFNQLCGKKQSKAFLQMCSVTTWHQYFAFLFLLCNHRVIQIWKASKNLIYKFKQITQKKKKLTSSFAFTFSQLPLKLIMILSFHNQIIFYLKYRFFFPSWALNNKYYKCWLLRVWLHSTYIV
jgi:hypothetical protein